MASEEALKSVLVTLSYMLMKRRRDINNAETQRRREVRRRVRHRQYFLQRQRRMLMVIGIKPLLFITHYQYTRRVKLSLLAS